MPSQTEIHPHTIQLVSKWRGDLVVFSDTFGEGAVGLGQGAIRACRVELLKPVCRSGW